MARVSNETTGNPVPAHFELLDDHTHRIVLDGPVDPTRELVIDPDVEWMTYLGGVDTDDAYGIVADGSGDSLIVGTTNSTDFEGHDNSYLGGYHEVVIAKVNASGQLQWMDYRGGTGGERGYAIAMDRAGHALITGITSSPDFDGRNNYNHGRYVDSFVLKTIAGGPVLTVNAKSPSGGPIQFSWSGATSGGTVAPLFARTTGSFTIPNNHPCAGTPLGLSSNQLQVVYQGSAGPNGSRTLNATAGPAACGGSPQLLDVTTCTTSNVATIN